MQKYSVESTLLQSFDGSVLFLWIQWLFSYLCGFSFEGYCKSAAVIFIKSCQYPAGTICTRIFFVLFIYLALNKFCESTPLFFAFVISSGFSLGVAVRFFMETYRAAGWLYCLACMLFNPVILLPYVLFFGHCIPIKYRRFEAVVCCGLLSLVCFLQHFVISFFDHLVVFVTKGVS